VGSDPVDWRQVRRAYISACLVKFHADVELVQIRVLHCGLSQRQLTATTSRGAPAIFIWSLKQLNIFSAKSWTVWSMSQSRKKKFALRLTRLRARSLLKVLR